MEDFTGAKAFVHYTSFSVGPEEEGYKLSFSGFIDGGAGEFVPSTHGLLLQYQLHNNNLFSLFSGTSLSEHNGQRFSTFDKDQDTYASNCAKTYLGGWWYGECHSVNPNGIYLWGSSTYGIGINWVSWKGYEYSLKYIAMKIKPSKE